MRAAGDVLLGHGLDAGQGVEVVGEAAVIMGIDDGDPQRLLAGLLGARLGVAADADHQYRRDDERDEEHGDQGPTVAQAVDELLAEHGHDGGGEGGHGFPSAASTWRMNSSSSERSPEAAVNSAKVPE